MCVTLLSVSLLYNRRTPCDLLISLGRDRLSRPALETGSPRMQNVVGITHPTGSTQPVIVLVTSCDLQCRDMSRCLVVSAHTMLNTLGVTCFLFEKSFHQARRAFQTENTSLRTAQDCRTIFGYCNAFLRINCRVSKSSVCE